VSTKAKERWIDVAALAGLAALTLVFFWRIALTNRVLVGLDVFAYFYPYRDFAGEALRAGRLPLWNPYLFMGAPLLANSQAAALYPLHWPLIWLSPPKQVAWSIVLHIWLAAAGTYLFGRRAIRLQPLASLTSAIIFSMGGFLSAQVEHVNQLNASAWLPWLLLCMDEATDQGRRRLLALLGGGAIVGLVLLAGHTQAAYIVLFGAGLYALFRGLRGLGGLNWQRGLLGVGTLALMAIVGVLLAAAQLLPTLELSRLSVRSGGLPYNEAASFSLKPGLVFKAFLPPLIWEPPFSEYIAYVGLIGLILAAVGIWVTLRQKRRGGVALIMALAGAFLALGAYNPVYYVLYTLVPGFDLFRAPARWLLLYSFGVALLAGIGLDATDRLGRWRPAVILLLTVELFVAGQRLAYNDPTAPAAVDSMRTAPAHLLADLTGRAGAANESGGGPFRFLSMSDIRYDPGDLGDLQAMYGSALPEEALYDLIVATKMKEVLAYNLPLRYRLFSVDGYDGGLLPIAEYVTLERLFLSEDEIWSDGRLRQQLRRVPPARLLSMLNVKYIITDKVQDVWIDGVFYDLEHTIRLGEVAQADLPDFQTTHLGLVSYLTGTHDLVDGTPVAEVTISSSEEAPLTMTLLAGEHTAEGVYRTGSVAHSQARVGHGWRGNEVGSDYVAVLDLGRALAPEGIALRSLLPGSRFHLRGMTLIDDKTGTSRAVSIDPAYKLVHSGDVKIYQNMAPLPRAYVVHHSRVVSDDEEALAILRDPGFDPAHEVILAEGETLDERGAASAVEIVDYTPEEVRLHVDLDAPGHLILTDTHYPGWKATVDGRTAPILRANLYFRAVPLEAGHHQVTFRFASSPTHWGLIASSVAWLAWALGVVSCVACHWTKARKWCIIG
jgi:hypothetical protein